MERYLPSRITLWLSFLLALIFSAAILYVALKHNPQGEFYEQLSGSVQWDAVLPLAIIGFAAGFIGFFILIYIMEKLWKAERHLLKDDGVDRGSDDS